MQLTWARSERGGKIQNTSCNLPGPGQGGGKKQNTSCNLPGPGQREVWRYKTCQATHPCQVVFSQREVCPGSLCGWFDLICHVGHALWLTGGRRGGILSLENETKNNSLAESWDKVNNSLAESWDKVVSMILWLEIKTKLCQTLWLEIETKWCKRRLGWKLGQSVDDQTKCSLG